jgi:hypothetical protein
MGRRVFIGQDYEGYNQSAIGADGDNAMLDQLFEGHEGVAGDDMEIVGSDEEIVGADEEIVGADVRQRPAQSDKLVYDQWLPLTGAAGISIAAGATYELELKPQRLFRPGRLTLTAAAQVLDLAAFSIGQENQFVAGGSLPGEFFKADAVGKQLTSQTAGPGTTILMSFTNTTAGAVILKGGWEGKSVVR